MPQSPLNLLSIIFLLHFPLFQSVFSPWAKGGSRYTHPSWLLTQQPLTEFLSHSVKRAQDWVRPGICPQELIINNFINSKFMSCYFMTFDWIPCGKSDIEVVYLIPVIIEPVRHGALWLTSLTVHSFQPKGAWSPDRVCGKGESGTDRTLTKTVKDATKIWKALFPERERKYGWSWHAVTTFMLLHVFNATSISEILTLSSIFGYKDRKQKYQTKGGRVDY